MRNKKTAGLCIMLFALTMMFIVSCQKEQGDSRKGEDVMSEQMTPLIDNNGADPWVIKQGEEYYYTKTTGSDITVFHSRNLSGIGTGEGQIVWQPGPELVNLWAPEIHWLDGVWYIYFAANTPDEEMHKMYVLVNENKDPMEGTWECLPVAGMDDKFAIDGTVLAVGTERYFIWSGWEGYENVQQNLYMARMISPTEVREEKVLLSQPEYEWEKQGEPLINEGPQVICRENTVNLVYSASGSWTDDYCLGLLTASAEDDLMNPEVWKKEEKPVFSSGNGVFGPGHNSFTVSPDGKEDFMVYHAARWAGAGWNRSIRLQPIAFDEQGKLLPGEPKASWELMDVPGGEPSRLRFAAEDFQLTQGLSLREKDGTLSDRAVTGFEESSDRLMLDVSMEKDGDCTILVFARLENCYDENNAVRLEIEVNGELFQKELYPSEYYQPVSLPCKLKKGKNKISVGSEAGGDEISIDRIEIIPSQE